MDGQGTFDNMLYQIESNATYQEGFKMVCCAAPGPLGAAGNRDAPVLTRDCSTSGRVSGMLHATLVEQCLVFPSFPPLLLSTSHLHTKQIVEYNVVPGEALTHADLAALAADEQPLPTLLEGQDIGVGPPAAVLVQAGWAVGLTGSWLACLACKLRGRCLASPPCTAALHPTCVCPTPAADNAGGEHGDPGAHRPGDWQRHSEQHLPLAASQWGAQREHCGRTPLPISKQAAWRVRIRG